MIPPAQTRYGRGRLANIRNVTTWRKMKPKVKDRLEFVKGHHRQWKVRYLMETEGLSLDQAVWEVDRSYQEALPLLPIDTE